MVSALVRAMGGGSNVVSDDGCQRRLKLDPLASGRQWVSIQPSLTGCTGPLWTDGNRSFAIIVKVTARSV
jgi:hypothetical protein